MIKITPLLLLTVLLSGCLGTPERTEVDLQSQLDHERFTNQRLREQLLSKENELGSVSSDNHRLVKENQYFQQRIEKMARFVNGFHLRLAQLQSEFAHDLSSVFAVGKPIIARTLSTNTSNKPVLIVDKESTGLPQYFKIYGMGGNFAVGGSAQLWLLKYNQKYQQYMVVQKSSLFDVVAGEDKKVFQHSLMVNEKGVVPALYFPQGTGSIYYDKVAGSDSKMLYLSHNGLSRLNIGDKIGDIDSVYNHIDLSMQVYGVRNTLVDMN